MSELVQMNVARSTSMAPQAEKLLRGSSIVDGCVLITIGTVMMVMGILTPISILVRIVELILGGGMLASGVLLLRAVMGKPHVPTKINLLPGEIALAAALLYLGTAMPAFHQGLVTSAVSYSSALIQFIAVVAGLVFGAIALALSGASRSARTSGKISPTAIVGDGVILITGTILLAIAFGQLPGSVLKPPQWNWLSFLGITVPGMLILLVREGVKEGTELWSRHSKARSAIRLVATEVLLIVGLAVMIFGSYTNLVLGLNGYTVGIKGNMNGLILMIAAIFFLVIVRGAFKLAFVQGNGQTSRQFMNKLLYVVGIVAFIYGERAVLSGQSPALVIGAAALPAVLILLGGLLVLIVGRVVDQKMTVG